MTVRGGLSRRSVDEKSRIPFVVLAETLRGEPRGPVAGLRSVSKTAGQTRLRLLLLGAVS